MLHFSHSCHSFRVCIRVPGFSVFFLRVFISRIGIKIYFIKSIDHWPRGKKNIRGKLDVFQANIPGPVIASNKNQFRLRKTER